ncbi:MAG: hypothetical protein ACYC7B_12575 [Burkholderiales bacterium]
MTRQLGCLNHATLTVEAIAARGPRVTAIILNSRAGAPVAGMDNAAALEKWLNRPVWRAAQMDALVAQLARQGAGPLQSHADTLSRFHVAHDHPPR